MEVICYTVCKPITLSIILTGIMDMFLLPPDTTYHSRQQPIMPLAPSAASFHLHLTSCLYHRLAKPCSLPGTLHGILGLTNSLMCCVELLLMLQSNIYIYFFLNPNLVHLIILMQ